MTLNIAQTELINRLNDFSSKRSLIALVGAPASGKSTLAHSIVSKLNADDPDCAAVLAMDGFHYDDRVLEARGHRARKGAPHTFDVAGLKHILQRLKTNDEAEIATPIFDRDLEISRAGAFIIQSKVKLIIVEGNYLLLNKAPWNSLRAMFDLTVFCDVPENVLADRLKSRWQSYDLSPDEIEAKVEANDMPNGRMVINESVDADLCIRNF